MGNKWEVWAFTHIKRDRDDKLSYEWDLAWQGQSTIRALYHAWRAKRKGAGCVKIEWR